MTKPFSPALKTAVSFLVQKFQMELGQLLSAEAQNLALGEVWSVQLEKLEWILPEPTTKMKFDRKMKRN